MGHTTVATYTNRFEAEMAAAMLSTAGLDPIVTGDDGGGVLPHVPLGMGGLTVRVPSDQVEEAADLLAAELVDLTDDDDLDRRAPRLGWRRRVLQVVAGLILGAIALAILGA